MEWYVLPKDKSSQKMVYEILGFKKVSQISVKIYEICSEIFKDI